jgi:hypothetical protein
MTDLRSKLIRLAYQRPELRGDLLPILRTASSFTLWKEYEAYQDEIRKAWSEAVTVGEDLAPALEEDLAAAYYNLRTLRMDKSKALDTSDAEKMLSSLFYRGVTSESQIAAWMSRVTTGNTAMSLAFTGYLLKTEQLEDYNTPSFKVFGALVEKAATERFWELAGRSKRVPVKKQKPKFDAPAIPPSLIPTNATGWQLYSTMPGANTAAKAIAKSMTVALQMAGRNVTPSNTDAANAKAVSAILSRMSKILQTHREVGASDSEPRYVMLKVLEKYLKMYLDTYDFPKTFGVIDNW